MSAVSFASFLSKWFPLKIEKRPYMFSNNCNKICILERCLYSLQLFGNKKLAGIEAIVRNLNI